MDIERVSPAEVGPTLAQDIAAVLAAALEAVPIAAPTAEAFLLETRHSDEPAAALWLVREGGAVVGFGSLTEPMHEYTNAAFLKGCVAPSHQRQGIGRALLGEIADHTRREVLRARAWRGTAGARALPALGFSRIMTHVVRRLDLVAAIPDEAALRAEVTRAAGGYELTRHRGPTPVGDLPEMVVLREAINDAPDAHEFEAYPVARIAAYEQSLMARRHTPYTIVARRRETEEPAGITMVCVPELAPQIAAQEDTSVLSAHRGHRLGLRLKLDMLDWLRTERPDVTAVDTWNDATNAPMIAVNQRLGTRIVAESSAYRRSRRRG